MDILDRLGDRVTDDTGESVGAEAVGAEAVAYGLLTTAFEVECIKLGIFSDDVYLDDFALIGGKVRAKLISPDCYRQQAEDAYFVATERVASAMAILSGENTGD